VFRYSRRAVQLVWSTSSVLTVSLALLTIAAGILPAAIAYIGSLIVDAVVAATRAAAANPTRVIDFVVLEGVLVALQYNGALRFVSHSCARNSDSV
jgi:ATP-binding cassette, subfamily B, bacterial